MLYEKNNAPVLDKDLFANPTSEYRGAPFWAWNCKLKKDVLLRQIEYMKEMGFGGFNMHTRSGMDTPYLGEEYMDMIKACRDKAKEEGMYAWLYDEDCWPSGFAGGFVTQTKAYRNKMVVFSPNPADFADKESGTAEGKPYLLAVYDLHLDEDGSLVRYSRIDAEEPAQGIKRYAYVAAGTNTPRYNNQAYVDTMSKEAISEFIRITHEAYKGCVGEDFGGAVPAIFTDEPAYTTMNSLGSPFAESDITMAWTTDFADTYYAAYGEDILEHLPELFLDLSDGRVSQTRYRYYNHACDRFSEAFSGLCGEWCQANNIAFAGHLRAEATLGSQTSYIGEAMRSYRYFDIPGVDMLCDDVELNTLKQAQSVVHQYQKMGMLSELYGVTGWDFDFRGHKFQGDWQAALGVTVRVPHLAWVSMKGRGKRDYPASINYQSPWYKDYSYVENHYARLNTVLTRGVPVVKVGVIHPIESYWLHRGPRDTNDHVHAALDARFENLTKWLLSAMVDFDFVSEALLPSQCGDITDRLTVGAMAYEIILVPACETLRRSTFEILKAFAAAGGRLIFLGDCPKYIDAAPSDEVRALYEACEQVAFAQADILKTLKKEQTLRIHGGYENLVHALRQDGDVKWLFLAHSKKNTQIDDIPCKALTLELDGTYIPELYDTVSGAVTTPDYETKNGKTYIYQRMFAYDSLLLRLTEGTGAHKNENAPSNPTGYFDFRDGVSYRREEDNVYLLDMAEYRLNNDDWEPADELQVINDKCRKRLNLQTSNLQPWLIGDEPICHYVDLRFRVTSRTALENLSIAAEEMTALRVNGQEIALTPSGYYVDEDIIRYPIGGLCEGENIIEIKTPVSDAIGLENMFLLGDFDVELKGCVQTLTAPSDTVAFGSIAHQGMPFYSGNLTYKATVDVPDCNLSLRVSRYRGAAVKVVLDGQASQIIAYPPYNHTFSNVPAGQHTLEFTLLGNRFNTFGALHACDYSTWYAGGKWSTFGTSREDAFYPPTWTYEYNLRDYGILTTPLVGVEPR